jgi:hypothetical protein
LKQAISGLPAGKLAWPSPYEMSAQWCMELDWTGVETKGWSCYTPLLAGANRSRLGAFLYWAILLGPNNRYTLSFSFLIIYLFALFSDPKHFLKIEQFSNLYIFGFEHFF